MKLRLVTCAATLLLLASGVAAAQERLRLTRYLHGHKYTVKVFDEDIQKMPSWNPETAEAPLSPRKVIQVARENIFRFIVKDYEKWVLDTVSLTQIGGPDSHKWLYQVEFINNDLLDTEMNHSFSIFVKMDGTIVEPEVVPRDGKAKVY